MNQGNALTLLVLAAGMGSRYGGLKQLDPVGPGGETIMDYSIFDACRAGFGKVVFVIRREIEGIFKEKIGSRYEKKMAVGYAFQETGELPGGFAAPAGRTKPWGTTHAILAAASKVNEPFCVINADDFYGAGSFRELAHHLQTATGEYAMVGFVLRDTLSESGTVSRGVCHVTEDGYLKDIAELKSLERKGQRVTNTDAQGREIELTGNEIVSMNMWGFTPAIFPQLTRHFEGFLKQHGGDLKAECYLPSSVNALIETDDTRVKVLRSRDEWFGVTYREDRPRVADSIGRLVETGSYPRELWR
jgi:NDP-sugar pyrophosphorylase family protein